MGLRSWLLRIAGVGAPPASVPSRHERREAARERHAEGGPAWSDADRHENTDGTVEVADIAPGTPGWGGTRKAGR